MSDRPKIYLAGPGVFSRDAAAIRGELLALCDHHGVEGLWPGDGESRDPREIFRRNIDLLRRADAVVAEITPFRGPHMDCGTAWEMGWADALDKLVIAWTAEFCPLSSRVDVESDDDGLRDKQGNLIENFGLIENLMISSSALRIERSAASAIVVAAELLKAYRR